MKTNKLSLIAALFTLASLPVSAGVALPRPKSPAPSPERVSDCCVTHATCGDKSCCATKTVANTNPGGRSGKVSSFLNYKKVRVCTESCKVNVPEQPDVCRKGARS